MKTLHKLFVTALFSAVVSAAQAQSAPTLGGGWAYDEVASPSINSTASPYDFTLASGAVFTLTDAFYAGDNYTVFDNGIQILDLTAPAPDINNPIYQANPDLAVLDPAFAHGSITLGAGAHDLTIQSDEASGIDPAGFYTRLDATASGPTVPDGGSLSMITGLVWAGLLGLGTLRTKRSPK